MADVRLPEGWAWTGPAQATLSTGKSYDILSCGKKVGVGWEITVKVTLTDQGLEVDVDDETTEYTHGSYTNAEIPWEVFNALYTRWRLSAD